MSSGLTPSEPDQQSNSSLDPTHCYNDEDCDEDATCVDTNSGIKQCFCYETGDFCKSRQKQPGMLTGALYMARTVVEG